MHPSNDFDTNDNRCNLRVRDNEQENLSFESLLVHLVNSLFAYVNRYFKGKKRFNQKKLNTKHSYVAKIQVFLREGTCNHMLNQNR